MTVRARPTLVSVLIPCRNGAATLPVQLEAMTRQTYTGDWEVLLLDNQSTDESAEIARSFTSRLPSLHIHPIETTEGVGAVRNAGLPLSSGDLIAVCDADDEVSDHWLEALIDAAVGADLVGGVLVDTGLNSPRALAWRGRARVRYGPPLPPFGYTSFAPGCNLAVWRDVAENVGGWRTHYRAGSEDVDFSWRIQEAGLRLAHAQDAVVQYRYRDQLRPLCRQFFTYGFTEAQLYSTFRDRPLQPYTADNVREIWGPLLKELWVARGDQRAECWREVSYRGGRLWGSLRHRVLVP